MVPVHNESENIEKLLLELSSIDLDGIPLDFVFVDDFSSDNTLEVLQRLRTSEPRLTVLAHETNAGQSAAIRTGVVHAAGNWIMTLDGDGQNDPADIPKFVRSAAELLPSETPILVAGDRTRHRKDTLVKRISSKIANFIRNLILRDNCPDSGCGMKFFSRQSFLNLPHFDHMHRFLPSLFVQSGGKLIMVPTGHRQRNGGSSHYGTWGRLWAGIIDLMGVVWLRRRTINVKVKKFD